MIKKIVVIQFFFIVSVYSEPDLNSVSPYINRGVSLYLRMYHNPLTIEYNYKKEASGEQYVGFANDIYLRQGWMRDFFVTTGSKDEKQEWSGCAMMLPWRFKFRHKYNVFDIGRDNIFQNLSFSPFYGISMAYYWRNGLTEHTFSQKSNGYIQTYVGTAFGTRKRIIDTFSYIEIFVSPQISLTYYGRLGGGDDYNPINKLDKDWLVSKYSVVMWDFSMPIGVGFKYRYFFIKSGISITTTLVGEERWRKGGKLTINSYNLPKIPIFMECGIHFRKFKQLEREMSN
ncbi:MAG: hypothetical protein LBH98_03275 [Chitinispirillales bacterium]|jgi:hypothetical protein|nr:hypothetical protein [Chitinispirillales bacterium]